MEKEIVRYENTSAIRIRQLLSEYKWTAYRLAKQSNVPLSSINNIFQRNTEPSIPTLKKICEGFNITMAEFFDCDMFNEPPQSVLSQEEKTLIRIFGKLSKSEKECMISYACGLAKMASPGVSEEDDEE